MHTFRTAKSHNKSKLRSSGLQGQTIVLHFIWKILLGFFSLKKFEKNKQIKIFNEINFYSVQFTLASEFSQTIKCEKKNS